MHLRGCRNASDADRNGRVYIEYIYGHSECTVVCVRVSTKTISITTSHDRWWCPPHGGASLSYIYIHTPDTRYVEEEMGRLCTHGNKGSVARRRASVARRRRARASEPDADGVDAPSTARTRSFGVVVFHRSRVLLARGARVGGRGDASRRKTNLFRAVASSIRRRRRSRGPSVAEVRSSRKIGRRAFVAETSARRGCAR